MRYLNGFNELIATEHSDLKYGEYRCTECNKVITREQVVPNNSSQNISTNSINFCSSGCRSESHKGYDRRVSF